MRLAGDGAGAHPSRCRAAARAHAAAALYYNLLWLIPFYTSPLVIHHYCGPGSRPKLAANGGHKDLLADPRLRTALDLHRNRWR